MTVKLVLPKFNKGTEPVINLDAKCEVNLLDESVDIFKCHGDTQQVLHIKYDDNGVCNHLLITGENGDDVVNMYVLLLGVFYSHETDDLNVSDANNELKEMGRVCITLRYMS